MMCFKDVDDEPGPTLRLNCRPEKYRTLVISSVVCRSRLPQSMYIATVVISSMNAVASGLLFVGGGTWKKEERRVAVTVVAVQTQNSLLILKIVTMTMTESQGHLSLLELKPDS